MRSSTLTLVRCVAALMILMPAQAVAQDSIAVGFGVSNSVGVGECPLDDCGSIARSVSGEGTFNITESLAAVVGIGVGFESLSTSVRGIAVDARGNSVTFGGGVRAYRSPGPTRAFAELLVGYGVGTVKVTVRGFRETVSYKGLAISPGAGVDIAMGERVAVRLSGGVSLSVSEGEASGSVHAGVGLVFGVGGG